MFLISFLIPTLSFSAIPTFNYSDIGSAKGNKKHEAQEFMRTIAELMNKQAPMQIDEDTIITSGSFLSSTNTFTMNVTTVDKMYKEYLSDNDIKQGRIYTYNVLKNNNCFAQNAIFPILVALNGTLKSSMYDSNNKFLFSTTLRPQDCFK